MNIITLDCLSNYTFKSVSEAWIDLNTDNAVLDIDYVPTEVEFWRKAQAATRNELYEANSIIEFGDIPEAFKEVAEALNYKINICQKDPIDVLDEFLREHGYECRRAM